MSSEAERGLVFRIEKFMISDGEGIRTNVFLKGCPLKCLWCFNPEGISGKPEILVFRKKCVQCLECEEICPVRAISMEDGHPRIDRDICDACGECADACSTGALEMCGVYMSIGEILDEVRKDELFYRRSGGGITVTGGELCAQPKFAGNLLRGCREEYHTAIETSGFAPWMVLEELIELSNQVFFDIKHMNAGRHQELTGVRNDLIVDNLKKASQIHDSITVRVPLIPGFNDSPENIRKTAEFVHGLGSIRKIEILPYVSLGKSKYEMLDLTYSLSHLKSDSSALIMEIVESVKSFGLECSVVT